MPKITDEHRVYDKAYRKANKEKIRARMKAYNLAHKEEKVFYNRSYYEANKEKCKEQAKKYYAKNKQNVIARRRVYFEANKGKLRELNRIYCETRKEQRQTNAKVREALKYGRLTKNPCEICGEKKVQGHHPDYSKPLEVVWLCDLCHRELHVQLRKESNVTNSGTKRKSA